MLKPFAAALLALSGLSAHALVLDFDGGQAVPSICSSSVDGSGAMVNCNDWSYLNQAYGDAPGVDVTYSHGLQPGQTLQWWADSYNDLHGVVFASGGDGPASYARIEFKPTAGGSVTLASFDLGAYPNTTRATIVDIYEIGNSTSLFHYAGDVGTGSTGHATFNVNLSSSQGLRIEFRDTAYNVGIDNIQFSVSAVPEPQTLVLMLLGLATVGALARRRR